MIARTDPGPAPRVLIVRLSAIGDVAMASGLIPALRALWPKAHLAWLTEPAAAPLLRHNQRLDEVLELPRGRWRELRRARRYGTLLGELRAFARRLRSGRFDLVLDAQGLLKSALCAWATRAPRRIGLRAREGSRWLVHERVEAKPGEDDPRIGREYRRLARYLGAPEAAFRLDIALGEEARAKARQALAACGVRGAYAVLCPFTTRAQKHWFEDRWADLGLRLREHGLTAVLLGGPDDVDAAARIAAAGVGIADLAGRLPLDASVAVIGEAALLVGVDTGLTHVGTALGVPTLALFGSTRPYLDPQVRTSRVLYDALECSPCRRHPTCGGRFDCMRRFSVERVLNEALALGGRGRPQRATIAIRHG